MKYWIIALFSLITAPILAANTNALLTPEQYNRMEPYLNPGMRTKLKPADSGYLSNSNQALRQEVSNPNTIPISNSVRSGEVMSGTRKVVARPRGSQNAQVARAAVSTARSGSGASVARSVVQRPTRSISSPRTTVLSAASNGQVAATTQNAMTGDISPSQCLAAYSQCMDNYCKRPTTKYNRCYCSSKLSQIDSTYKPAIDSLSKQIIMLKNGGYDVDQDDINDYWDSIFGATGDNSMADLDNGLNIDWSDTESSVRGQNAFVSGDNYCKQALNGCAYMFENLKSMYRTTIGQDCKTYETYLYKIKTAAEQVVAGLQE